MPRYGRTGDAMSTALAGTAVPPECSCLCLKRAALQEEVILQVSTDCLRAM